MRVRGGERRNGGGNYLARKGMETEGKIVRQKEKENTTPFFGRRVEKRERGQENIGSRWVEKERKR